MERHSGAFGQDRLYWLLLELSQRGTAGGQLLGARTAGGQWVDADALQNDKCWQGERSWKGSVGTLYAAEGMIEGDIDMENSPTRNGREEGAATRRTSTPSFS